MEAELVQQEMLEEILVRKQKQKELKLRLHSRPGALCQTFTLELVTNLNLVEGQSCLNSTSIYATAGYTIHLFENNTSRNKGKHKKSRAKICLIQISKKISSKTAR